MNDNEIVITNNKLFEFQIDDFTSLFYDTKKSYWFIEYIDKENGEEFIETIDIDSSIPHFFDGFDISLEDVNYFKKIVEKGWENES